MRRHKDARAKSAIQAVNAAWATLRDASKRAQYNAEIVQKACAEEGREKLLKGQRKQAETQKRRKEETEASANKKQKKTSVPKETEEKPSKETAAKTSSSSGKPEPKPKSKPASSADGKPSKEPNFEFVKFHEHKNHLVCRSSMNKFHRKFENKLFAGATHAKSVALQFQKIVEDMMTQLLSMKKLDELKEFCTANEIEKPEGGRLSKAFMQDYIEEAHLLDQTSLCLFSKSTFLSSVSAGKGWQF